MKNKSIHIIGYIKYIYIYIIIIIKKFKDLKIFKGKNYLFLLPTPLNIMTISIKNNLKRIKTGNLGNFLVKNPCN